MLHIKPNPNLDWTRQREPSEKPNSALRLIVYTVVVMLLASALFLVGWQAIAHSASREATDLNSNAAKNQLTSLYAQDLYLTGHVGQDNPALVPFGSLESTQALLASLQRGQPPAKRTAAITALTQAPPTVVPALLNALSDNDPGVREGAAQVLGARRAPEAEDQLFFATFDSDPSVRAAAVAALGELGTPFALPRLQWLQLTETDSNVQVAAQLAENDIRTSVAAMLGIQPSNLHAIAVAPSDGRVYAATPRDLYAHGQSTWERVGSVPDVPTALVALGDKGQLLYLGTASAGVFRSADGGHTWQSINEGLPAANPFAVTALTIDPDHPRQMYLTLATQSGRTPLMPYGLFVSTNGGDSWTPLTQWNVDDITTRLIVDPNAPARLLGLTRAGVWQYPLTRTNANTP
jgi:HEAT repeats